MFEYKAKKSLLIECSTLLSTGLICTRQKILMRSKHSSLFGAFVSYKEKHFDNIGTWLMVLPLAVTRKRQQTPKLKKVKNLSTIE
jgi:hypothetical protein